MAVNKYKKYSYKIEASCGCKMTVAIGGYSEDYRQARKRELEAEECPKCAGKRRAEQVKNSLDFELAELEGSEKQIAWAESIRADKIRESKDNKEFIKILGNATSAKLLIENRNEELNTLIEKIIFSNVVIPEKLEDEETFKTIEEEIIVASGYTKETIEKFRRILIKKVETCGYLYYSKEDLERVLIYLKKYAPYKYFIDCRNWALHLLKNSLLDRTDRAFKRLEKEKRATKGLNLAKLQGNIKEIERAKIIRVNILDKLTDTSEKQLIASVTNAVFFIENRENNVCSVIENLKTINAEIEENAR